MSGTCFRILRTSARWASGLSAAEAFFGEIAALMHVIKIRADNAIFISGARVWQRRGLSPSERMSKEKNPCDRRFLPHPGPLPLGEGGMLAAFCVSNAA